jgi:neopullulanase
VLDGVFNHASRGFWAFHHILENGSNSPYIDWFLIKDWPLRPYDNPKNEPINYEAWWGIAALPKFNIKNPGVRDYLLGVAEYWIQFGIDGWRLDVPEEIKDAQFWREFRKVVKRANPDAYLVGEIWHEAPAWLKGDRFDAVMNYIFSRAALGFFAAETLRIDYKPGGKVLAPMNATAFAKTVDTMLSLYDWEIILAQLNLIDSHDTARTLWMVGGDESALRLCTLFQMTMPGAPCIYYGDEIGMTGGHDPLCRGAFPWHDESQWNHDLLNFYRRAIHLRHCYPVLSVGSFKTLYADHHLYAFRRDLDGQTAVVVFNAGQQAASVDLEVGADLEGRLCVDMWQSGRYTVKRSKLAQVQVPAREAAVLIG